MNSNLEKEITNKNDISSIENALNDLITELKHVLTSISLLPQH
ncbi:hypothetical protein MHK_006781 [Candidatus Magnetomorum sp. HK-1]|nr:hypothetical protein MHK_006781 [Candidatus Magnetomorum sp. HK-1]